MSGILLRHFADRVVLKVTGDPRVNNIVLFRPPQPYNFGNVISAGEKAICVSSQYKIANSRVPIWLTVTSYPQYPSHLY